MDYKKELLEMIQKMENIRFLAMAYGFVGRLYQKEKERKNSMDCKKEIENFLNEIQSEKFLKFLYNVIVSFKKQWGY